MARRATCNILQLHVFNMDASQEGLSSQETTPSPLADPWDFILSD